MTFRKDINGLRAIAVLAVVLFHFKVTGFQGGFSGVDIFFVISGYLMTGIIFTKLRQDNFSIIDFYLSRAKRIIPALSVLCIVLILFGLCYLQLDDYRELLRNIKRSILFFSNIAFYHKTGYFDAPMQENWLLHTWSLSVEWQFYVIYPIIIVILHRFFSEKITKTVLLTLAILSFITTLYYAIHDPMGGFYLLPARAWELIAGGLVFLFPLTLNSKTRLSLELSGLILVLVTIFYFSASYIWPSYFALLPVIGVIFILYGNRDSFITNNSLSQFFGKISYSLYLWHWPIAVFIYLCGFPYNNLLILMSIMVSVLLATLSYYFIEQYFLKSKKTNRIKQLIKYIMVLILIGLVISPVIASLVRKYAILPNQAIQTSPIEKKVYPHKMSCLPTKNDVSDCEFGDGKPSVIIMGDSHAGSIAPAVQAVNPDKTLLWSRGGCPILKEFTFKNNKENNICHNLIDSKFKLLKDAYPNVPLIIMNRSSLYVDPIDLGGHFITFKGIERRVTPAYLNKYRSVYIDTMCALSKNRPVYVVKPIPEMLTNVPKSLAMQAHFISNLKDIILPLEAYEQRHKFVLSVMDEVKNRCNIKLLDPIDYLCPNGKECLGSKNGTLFYLDDNHLSEAGASLLEPMFKTIFIK